MGIFLRIDELPLKVWESFFGVSEPEPTKEKASEEGYTAGTVRRMALACTRALGELCVAGSNSALFYPFASFTLSMRHAHLGLKTRSAFQHFANQVGEEVKDLAREHKITRDTTVLDSLPQRVESALLQYQPSPLSLTTIPFSVAKGTAGFIGRWSYRAFIFGAVPYYTTSLFCSSSKNHLIQVVPYLATLISAGLLFRARINDIVKGLDETSERPVPHKLNKSQLKAVKLVVKELARRDPLDQDFTTALKDLTVDITTSPFSAPPGKLDSLKSVMENKKKERDALVKGKDHKDANKIRGTSPYVQADTAFQVAFAAYFEAAKPHQKTTIAKAHYKAMQQERDAVLSGFPRDPSRVAKNKTLSKEEKIAYLRACLQVDRTAVQVYSTSSGDHMKEIATRQANIQKISAELTTLGSPPGRASEGVLDSDDDGPGAGAGAGAGAPPTAGSSKPRLFDRFLTWFGLQRAAKEELPIIPPRTPPPKKGKEEVDPPKETEAKADSEAGAGATGDAQDRAAAPTGGAAGDALLAGQMGVANPWAFAPFFAPPGFGGSPAQDPARVAAALALLEQKEREADEQQRAAAAAAEAAAAVAAAAIPPQDDSADGTQTPPAVDSKAAAGAADATLNLDASSDEEGSNSD